MGRIKSIQRTYSDCNGRKLKVMSRILKQRFSADGYLKFSVSKHGVMTTYKTHRPVAMHFIENVEKKSEVNHIDGVKTNNMVSNLEWNTSKENIQHAYKNGLMNPLNGENGINSKLTELDVIEIRKMRTKGLKQSEIAKQFDVARTTIRDVLSKKNWAHIA